LHVCVLSFLTVPSVNYFHSILPLYTVHFIVSIAWYVSRGSAFPTASIAREQKCLWDRKKRLAICGDFCVSPNVEGAILSGLAAASKLTEMLSCL